MSLSLTIRRRAVRAIMSLPAPVLRAIAGGTKTVEGHDLDAQLAAGLRFADRLGARLEELDPPRARTRSAALLAPFEPEPPLMAAIFDERAGTIPVRVFVPADAGGGLVVFFHGGGGVIGSVDAYDGFTRVLAQRTGHAVASVDYRLAPEHPHPAAIDDAIFAYAWIAEHAARWGADRARLAITGDSFGGFLAMHAARGAIVRPRLAAPVYPLFDLTRSSPSYRTFAEGYGLTLPLVQWFRDHYAPDPTTHRAASPLFWPAAELVRLPPVHVVTAHFDPLRDEAFAMVNHLRAAGVAVDHVVHGGLIHGFLEMTNACDAADLAVTQLADALAAALAPAVVRPGP